MFCSPPGAMSKVGGADMRQRLSRMLASPVNQRRLQNFRANKRGYWSFWIFLVLFILSLGAELIANDNPVLVSYQDKLYYPMFKTYPETEFGGFLPTETSFRDPFIIEVIESDGWLIWPPIR